MVPVATAMRLFDQASLNRISLLVRPGFDLARAEQRCRAVLLERHGVEDFTLTTPTAILEAFEDILAVLTLALSAIAAISLVVAGIGIMNVMLVSVTERTREIGLRLAVGARRRDVLVQFLMEALILSLIGGAIGVAMGLSSALLLGHVAEWRVEVVPEVVVIAFGFAGLVGVLFGTYPALKAAALDPIEALRWE
jgi:ABC-type antimicrobial peptide transport system permease subunit